MRPHEGLQQAFHICVCPALLDMIVMHFWSCTGGKTEIQRPFSVLQIIFMFIYLLSCSFLSVINVMAFALHLVSVQRCLKQLITSYMGVRSSTNFRVVSFILILNRQINPHWAPWCSDTDSHIQPYLCHTISNISDFAGSSVSTDGMTRWIPRPTNGHWDFQVAFPVINK